MTQRTTFNKQFEQFNKEVDHQNQEFEKIGKDIDDITKSVQGIKTKIEESNQKFYADVENILKNDQELSAEFSQLMGEGESNQPPPKALAYTSERTFFDPETKRKEWISEQTFHDDILTLQTRINKLNEKFWNGPKKSQKVEEAFNRAIAAGLKGEKFKDIQEFINYKHKGEMSINDALLDPRMPLLCCITPESSQIFKNNKM